MCAHVQYALCVRLFVCIFRLAQVICLVLWVWCRGFISLSFLSILPVSASRWRLSWWKSKPSAPHRNSWVLHLGIKQLWSMPSTKTKSLALVFFFTSKSHKYKYIAALWMVFCCQCMFVCMSLTVQGIASSTFPLCFVCVNIQGWVFVTKSGI